MRDFNQRIEEIEHHLDYVKQQNEAAMEHVEVASDAMEASGGQFDEALYNKVCAELDMVIDSISPLIERAN